LGDLFLGDLFLTARARSSFLPVAIGEDNTGAHCGKSLAGNEATTLGLKNDSLEDDDDETVKMGSSSSAERTGRSGARFLDGATSMRGCAPMPLLSWPGGGGCSGLDFFKGLSSLLMESSYVTMDTGELAGRPQTKLISFGRELFPGDGGANNAKVDLVIFLAFAATNAFGPISLKPSLRLRLNTFESFRLVAIMRWLYFVIKLAGCRIK